MARGFGSTFGTGSTDAVVTGYSTSASNGSRSYSIWFYARAGLNLTVFPRLFDNNAAAASNVGNEIGFLNTGIVGYARAWGTADGTFAEWSCPIPSTNAWHHLVVTYNGGSSANVPAMYIDGVAQTVTTVLAPTGTIRSSNTPFFIGSNSFTAPSGFDGNLAEFSMWTGILTSSEALALSKGIPPLLIRPASLLLYCPLFGLQTNEQDWGPSHVAATVTGAKIRPHAPVSLWQQPSTMFVPQQIPVTGIGPSSYKQLYLPKLRMRARI